MKTLFLYFIATFVCMLFMCVCCVEEPVNVMVENDSDNAIGCYLSSYYCDDENSLPEREPTLQFVKRIEPGKFYYNAAINNLSILYIFDSDTLEKYTWKEICEGNKYMGVYRLNKCKLKMGSDPKLFARINYPAIDTMCCDTCGMHY